MTALLGILLVAAVAFFIGGPILRPPAAARAEAADRDARREILLRQLGELEYDYRMGKVGRDDYQQQRAGLMGRL